MEFENAARNCHHQRPRGLVHIRLHTERAGGGEVLLRVPGTTVACISGQPAIEVIAVAQEKAAGVRCMLVDSISARILSKETCSLDANFLPASFLGHRSRSAHQDSKNRCHYNFPIHLSPSLCVEFPSQQQTQFDQTSFARQSDPAAECCRRGLDSVTMPRADNAVWAGEAQKYQKRRCCDKQKRHHKDLLHPRVNLTHCKRSDVARAVSRCRWFVSCLFRKSKLVGQSASISRAISFSHETLLPLPR